MDIVKRDVFIKQLKDMIDMLKKCPKDMDFHVIVEFSGLDPRFMELARQYNIKRAIEYKREQEKNQSEEKGGNI